jgi:hypothetical protein
MERESADAEAALGAAGMCEAQVHSGDLAAVA